ncbi:MAG: Bug family tripartite tricarboxylate transporter substrate binding protein [Rhodospirillales bacterium]
MLNRLFAGTVAAAAIATLCAAPAARADAVSDFYKDKDITVVVAFGEGGGYSIYARTLAQFWGKHIPGHPNVIVQFMPGAGGVKAANYLFNVAPKDGSYVGMPSNSYALGQALQEGGIKYDAAEAYHLGRIDNMNSAIMVWHTAPATTLKEMETKEVLFGGTGKASQDYMNPTLMKNLLGMKYRVVLGYTGSKEVNLAMERGEVHGMANSWASVKSVMTQKLEKKELIPVAMVSLTPAPDAKHIPVVKDLAKTEEARDLLELMASTTAVGRVFILPPGVPADRAAALRKAFADTMKDRDFIAEAEKRKMDLDPMSGEEVQKIVVKAAKTPAEMVAKFKKAIE